MVDMYILGRSLSVSLRLEKTVVSQSQRPADMASEVDRLARRVGLGS